jgi:hypothetical protein
MTTAHRPVVAAITQANTAEHDFAGWSAQAASRRTGQLGG